MTSRPRRAMNNSSALVARRTQAARDALRRRQKEKKARIVKRHVRYKQTQKLLSQLAMSEREEPIVAPELMRSDDEQEDYLQHAGTGLTHADIEPTAAAEENDVQHEVSWSEPREAEPENLDKVGDGKRAVKNRSKYIPFAKEKKQFEEMKKKREQEQKERKERIEQRETMLKGSKKRRKEQAKQYRAVTHRGQPKMKHRVDALLARIQTQ